MVGPASRAGPVRAEIDDAYQSYPPDPDLFLHRNQTASALANPPSLRCRSARGTYHDSLKCTITRKVRLSMPRFPKTIWLLLGEALIHSACGADATQEYEILLQLAPAHHHNRVHSVELDFAARMSALQAEASFNQYSLRVEAIDGSDGSTSLPFRWDHHWNPTDQSYDSSGRLVFMVPDPNTTQVRVAFGSDGPPAAQAGPVDLIGDGDRLRIAGTGKSRFLGIASNPYVVDLDGDGQRDLVGTGWYGVGAPATWFRNVSADSTPLFSERETYPLATPDGEIIGNPPNAWALEVTVHDWDADGAWDLITRGRQTNEYNGPPLILFHRNLTSTGHPTFSSGHVLYTSQLGSQLRGGGKGHLFRKLTLGVADWDGDSTLDLLIGADSHIYFMSNTSGNGGDASFSEPVALLAAGREIDFVRRGKPSVGDWDADGDLDLLCGCYFEKPGPESAAAGGRVQGIYYFENVGNRTQPRLATARQLRDSTGQVVVAGFLSQPTMVDWNNDGKMDVLVSPGISGEGGTTVYLNRGTAAQPHLVAQPMAYRGLEPVRGSDFASPTVVDLDKDGTLDIVLGDAEGYVRFFRGNGSLQYAKPVKLKSSGREIDEGGESDIGEAHRGYVKVVFADWNGDDNRDMIMWTMNGEDGWLNGWGPKSHSLKFFPGTSDPLDFGTPVEIRADGRQIVAGWRCKPDVVDLDADGLLDLIQTTGHGEHESDFFTIMFFRNRGTQNNRELAAPVPLTLAGGRAMLPERNEGRRMCVRLADWDSDGDLDLFTARDHQANFLHPGVRYWENVGSSRRPVYADFKTLERVNKRMNSWHEVAVDVADLDQDGSLDLLIGHGDQGTVHFFRRAFLEVGYLPAEVISTGD